MKAFCLSISIFTPLPQWEVGLFGIWIWMSVFARLEPVEPFRFPLRFKGDDEIIGGGGMAA